MLIIHYYHCMIMSFFGTIKLKITPAGRERQDAVDNRTDETVRQIALRLRRIRELKGLTREKFCEPLGENYEYWGLIERGEQPISLPKLLQVCQVYALSQSPSWATPSAGMWKSSIP